MFLYILGIIYRERKVDEVEVKNSNLKSKFFKQVRLDRTQVKELVFSRVCGARNIPVTAGKEKVVAKKR